MAGFVQAGAMFRMAAAPEAITGVLEGADFSKFGDEAKQGVAAFAAEVLEEHQLVAVIAMKGFHGPGNEVHAKYTRTTYDAHAKCVAHVRLV
jgi:hypothetical protein